jgi:hypothetical protein
MIIRVVDGRARVEEGDDCTRLHVATDSAAEPTDAALRAEGLGFLADLTTAQLSVEQLRAQASAHAATAEWPDRWDAMIAYARGKGWLSADGALLQGHVEGPKTGH